MIESIESSNTSAFTNRGLWTQHDRPFGLHHRPIRQVAEYQVTDIPDGIRQHPYRRDRLPTLEAAEFSPVTNPENGFTRFYNKFGRFHICFHDYFPMERWWCQRNWFPTDIGESDESQLCWCRSCCCGKIHPMAQCVAVASSQCHIQKCQNWKMQLGFVRTTQPSSHFKNHGWCFLGQGNGITTSEICCEGPFSLRTA